MEWLSCGGARLRPQSEFPAGVHEEGWSMCRAALRDIAGSGHTAVAVLDARLSSAPTALRSYLDSPHESVDVVELDPHIDVQESWKSVYGACDRVLVIAPECDRMLPDALDRFDLISIPLLNASIEFCSAAGDKFETAVRLNRAGVPHPPTCLLDELSETWMKSTANSAATWIVKPRDGVSGDGLVRCSSTELVAMAVLCKQSPQAASTESPTACSHIVQPWISGEPFSRSAIVRSDGTVLWLPIVRQFLEWNPLPAYIGGEVEPNVIQQSLFQHRRANRGNMSLPAQALALEQRLQDMLNATLAALGPRPRGWIGVDFNIDWSNKNDPVTIIEVNPRMTTSFVGLTASCGGGLIEEMTLTAASSRSTAFRWQQLRFSAKSDVSSN